MTENERIIDISWPLDEKSTSYKNKPFLKLFPVKTFSKEHVRETKITLNSHTGTHIDAPAHFLQAGKTIDQEPLQKCVGWAKIIDMTNMKKRITASDIQDQKIEEGDIILFKTHNSFHTETDQFDPNFVYLAPSAAKLLVDIGVKAVGIDYLGIERGDLHHSTHQTLLKADIAIIEGLRLAKAQKAEYYFVCLPIAIKGIDAAPARAVLIDWD